MGVPKEHCPCRRSHTSSLALELGRGKEVAPAQSQSLRRRPMPPSLGATLRLRVLPRTMRSARGGALGRRKRVGVAPAAGASSWSSCGPPSTSGGARSSIVLILSSARLCSVALAPFAAVCDFCELTGAGAGAAAELSRSLRSLRASARGCAKSRHAAAANTGCGNRLNILDSTRQSTSSLPARKRLRAVALAFVKRRAARGAQGSNGVGNTEGLAVPGRLSGSGIGVGIRLPLFEGAEVLVLGERKAQKAAIRRFWGTRRPVEWRIGDDTSVARDGTAQRSFNSERSKRSKGREYHPARCPFVPVLAHSLRQLQNTH